MRPVGMSTSINVARAPKNCTGLNMLTESLPAAATRTCRSPCWRLSVAKGASIDGKTFKVHLDGYDQTPMLTGAGPSNRHEVWYFAQTKLGAVRVDDWKYQFIDQPQGWIGPVE